MLRRRPLTSVVLALALSACRGAPDAMTVALSPDPAYTTDDLALVASLAAADVVHADRLDVQITWTVDGAAQADLDGAHLVPADRTAKGQVWQAAAVALNGDKAGELALASVTISNSLPVAAADVDPTTPADADVVASASATDADDDTVSFTWTWTVDGEPSDIATDTVPADLTTKGQVWEATVTPNDGEADGEPVVISTSIANVAPVVTEITLEPADPATDGVLTANVVAQDGDDDAVTLRYEWLVDGVVALDSAADTLDGSLFAKHQVVTARVTPNDGFVDGAPFTSDAVTVVNSAPALESATIEPAALHVTESPSCAANGWTDLDEDPEDVRYAWTVNGELVATSQAVELGAFVKGDVLACSATPWDGEVEGATVVSDSVTVLNSAPTIASAALSTPGPTEADTLSVVLAGADDADDDALSYSYSWSVNGVAVASTPTLDGSSFKRGDTITVTVTPNDGTLDGAPVTSDTATVVNSAPLMVSAVIAPANPLTNDTLSASVSASDADGDAVSYGYAWTVNGAPAGTSATLAGEAFSKHQVVGVSVTANDGNADSAPLAAATVTVLNSEPTPPAVELSPLHPNSKDDLSCLVTAESTDADNDSITYSIAWTVDGAPYNGPTTQSVNPGDTVPFANTSNNQTWECTFTPDDGETTGADAVASAPVQDSDGTVRHTDGSIIPVRYVKCGTGALGGCTAAVANSSCQSIGMRVVSHASDDTSTTRSLGATASCFFSTSYYTSYQTMPSGSCLVGVSNLDWSSCCGRSDWHGNTMSFGTANTTFGYVSSNDTGFVSSNPNVSGTHWGCTGMTTAASNFNGCTTQYVACAR